MFFFVFIKMKHAKQYGLEVGSPHYISPNIPRQKNRERERVASLESGRFGKFITSGSMGGGKRITNETPTSDKILKLQGF